jgi:hypothetical protein
MIHCRGTNCTKIDRFAQLVVNGGTSPQVMVPHLVNKSFQVLALYTDGAVGQ